MGLFTREGEQGFASLKKVNVAGAAIAGLFASATAIGSFYINEAREVSLEVKFGQVTDIETTPGLKFKTPWLSSRYSYSLARQTSEVGAGTTLRTSDDVRLSNPFKIEWEIDENADLQSLYSELKGTGSDISDVVEVRARDAAVQVFETLTVADLAEEGFTANIKTLIKSKLLNNLLEQGWPVRVLDVLSDGFTLSPGSESALDAIVDIRQEAVRLDLRLENASKAVDVYKKEAEADKAYLDELSSAGLPEDDLVCALQYKMARDAGRVMQPFAQVCGADNDSGASVTLSQSELDELLGRVPSTTEISAPYVD